MLTVTTAATSTNLTTLDAVKDDLGLTSTDEDDYIESLIERVSLDICGIVGAAVAEDGTVTLGRETLVKTFRLNGAYSKLLLPRAPTVSITSVVADGDTLVAADYEVSKVSGLLTQLSDDDPISWDNDKVVVTYVAGWLLPDDTGRNLPLDIEAAAIALVKLARFNRTRDPTLKSENILEGLYSYQLFAPDDFKSGVPVDIMQKLNRYRLITAN